MTERKKPKLDESDQVQDTAYLAAKLKVCSRTVQRMVADGRIRPELRTHPRGPMRFNVAKVMAALRNASEDD